MVPYLWGKCSGRWSGRVEDVGRTNKNVSKHLSAQQLLLRATPVWCCWIRWSKFLKQDTQAVRQFVQWTNWNLSGMRKNHTQPHHQLVPTTVGRLLFCKSVHVVVLVTLTNFCPSWSCRGWGQDWKPAPSSPLVFGAGRWRCWIASTCDTRIGCLALVEKVWEVFCGHKTIAFQTNMSPFLGK